MNDSNQSYARVQQISQRMHTKFAAPDWLYMRFLLTFYVLVSLVGLRSRMTT